MTEGNIFQGELTIDQLLFNRPVPGYAQYRAPVRGMYMCGSSTHPGGGVMGAPGANAARAVLGTWAGRIEHAVSGRTSRYDCIVIGGGHNGLVCAATWRAAAARCWCSRRSRRSAARRSRASSRPAFKVSACAHLLHLMPAALVRRTRARAPTA